MKKLTTFQLKRLDEHIYKREGVSLLEPYLQVSEAPVIYVLVSVVAYYSGPVGRCWLIDSLYMADSSFTLYTPISNYIATTYYQKSFFPRTIIEWNNLPNNIIESDTSSNYLTIATTAWY